MSAVLNQPVVIDNGTGIIKAGFAGADKPKVKFAREIAEKYPASSLHGGAGATRAVDQEGGGWF